MPEEITINVDDSDQITEITQDKVDEEKKLKTNQAATVTIGKSSEEASQAPVTTDEYSTAATALRSAKNREDSARENFIIKSTGLTRPVAEVTQKENVVNNLNSAKTKTNNLYPDPETIQLNSQEEEIITKYKSIPESSIPPGELNEYNAAVAKQEKYQNAKLNEDFGNDLKNYQTQVETGNVGVVDNGERILERIDEKLEDPTISDEEKSELESIKSNIQTIDNNVQNNPEIAERKDGYVDAKERAVEAESDRNEAEENIRNLNARPGAEEAKTKLDQAERNEIESVRQDQPAEEARPTSDPDARALATTNKILIDSFSGQNSTPFYMQFPTLKAITDFRLRNGFSPYGTANPTEVARDAIHFNIFEGALGEMEIQEIEGTGLKTSFVKNAKEKTMGSFTIYPNNPDWLSLSHNHTYSDTNPLESYINPVLQFVNTGTNLLKAVGNIASNEPTSARAVRRVDFVDQYQSTEKLSLNIPFVLFTKGNFIEDIYIPIMFLTALSYPKRLYDSDIREDGKKIAKLFETNAGEESFLSEGASFLSERVSDVEDLVIKYGNVGAFRYVITQRPEYLSVRHASGLFFFKLASILNFSYNYKGPWINSRGDVVPEAVGRNNFSQSLSNMLNRNKNRQKAPYAFPSIAECSMTVKSVEPLFRQDWLNLLQGASDSSGRGIVRVSEQNTGVIGPDGERLNPVNIENVRTRITERETNRNPNTPPSSTGE